MPSLPVALTGGLTITAGPSHLLDGALQLARFDFAPRDFDVEAPLLATTPADWTTACPPAYIGATPLRGALVVHVDAQLFSCSAESHARAAREHGAVGWLWWENAQVVLAYDPEPGILRHQWNPGDARALGVAAGDISQRPALPLIDALLDGHSGPIRARARPSVSQWEVRDGWPLALWSAVFALACATTFELAAARLVSFVRADGGVRASTSQLMLMLEMLLAVMRFASLVIDPWFSRGVYPARLAQAMATYAGPVVSVATSLFLAYFMSAADNSGFAVSNGRFRRLVINVGLLALVGDVTFTALVAWRRPPILVVLKIVWTVVALPIALLALSVATHLRVRARLSGLVSERIFARLISRLRLSIACSALSFALGLAAFWALYRPWRQLGVLGMASLANALTSYVRIDAFRAGFVNVPRGPIHRTARALARLGGARASYSARAHSSTTQRPSLMTHVEGATLATLPAAHEAGADAERSEWRADDSSRSRSLSIGTRAGLGARARASDGDAPDAFELPLPSVMRSPSLVELASSGAATPAKALRHRTPHNTRRRAITEAAVQPGLVDFEPHAPACTPPVIPRLAPRTPSITPTNPRRTPRAPTVTPVVPRRNEPARPPRASLGRTRSGGLLLASQLDAKLRALVAPSVFKNSQGHINDARAHLLLGVSLDFIQTLAQTESLGADTTTADVANIVREHTRASMRSLCEMTLGTVQAGRPLVGKATHFVRARTCLRAARVPRRARATNAPRRRHHTPALTRRTHAPRTRCNRAGEPRAVVLVPRPARRARAACARAQA
mgnify:CR=1 FL=1